MSPINPQAGGLDGFRRLSRLFSLAATAVFGLIVLLMVLAAAVVALRLHVLSSRTVWRLGLSWAPMAFYLWALWRLRRLFKGLAEGDLVFTPVLSAAVAQTGWGLLLGGCVTIGVLPAILAVSPTRSAAGFVIGGLPALTLSVVGAALIALSVLLRMGAALQAKTLALETTLGEFI